LYFAAGTTTIVALIILWALQPLEQIYSKKFKQKTLRIVTRPGANTTAMLKLLLGKPDLKIQTFTLDKEDDGYIFQMKLDPADITKFEDIISELKNDPAIKEIFWTQ